MLRATRRYWRTDQRRQRRKRGTDANVLPKPSQGRGCAAGCEQELGKGTNVFGRARVKRWIQGSECALGVQGDVQKQASLIDLNPFS